MKIICAPDSFKESLTAERAAEVMADAVRRISPAAEIEVCPVSDGGEGFASVIARSNSHTNYASTCSGPLDNPVKAHWCLLGPDESSIAVIEMAQASGLQQVPADHRDPTRTTTFGTGELIRLALKQGACQITIGIGGSATNDGGCGMAQALGVCFYEADDHIIIEPITGGMLESITRIDVSQINPRLRETQVTVACDVTNPLTGLNGAAHVYAPQKGATPQQVEQLDAGLWHLAGLFRDQLGMDVEHRPGAGAAGGLGAGLMAFCGAQFRPGLDIVLEMVGFDKRVRDCDLCLTGEGKLDGQSLSGKAVVGVAQAAAKHNVPTIALVGSLGEGHEKSLDAGLKDYIEIGRGLSTKESMARAAELLVEATVLAVSMHT
jgi:glycerate 2-kinase